MGFLFKKCMKCEYFSSKYTQLSREDFIKSIKTLKTRVKDNDVSILEPNEEYQGNLSDFERLPSSPPFPDIMHFKFKCNGCMKRYEIFMNWYQANGEISKINFIYNFIMTATGRKRT